MPAVDEQILDLEKKLNLADYLNFNFELLFPHLLILLYDLQFGNMVFVEVRFVVVLTCQFESKAAYDFLIVV